MAICPIGVPHAHLVPQNRTLLEIEAIVRNFQIVITEIERDDN